LQDVEKLRKIVAAIFPSQGEWLPALPTSNRGGWTYH